MPIHPLTQNDQFRHGNTYGEGHVFRSATSLHLHKRIARFVSDSWVYRFTIISQLRWQNHNVDALFTQHANCCPSPFCCITRLAKNITEFTRCDHKLKVYDYAFGTYSGVHGEHDFHNTHARHMGYYTDMHQAIRPPTYPTADEHITPMHFALF